MMARASIAFLSPDVIFGRNREPVMGRLHAALGAALLEQLREGASDDQPTLQAQAPIEGGIADAQTLSDLVDQAHANTAAELDALSIDSLVSSSTSVAGNASDARSSYTTGDSKLYAWVTQLPDYDPPPIPPGTIDNRGVDDSRRAAAVQLAGQPVVDKINLPRDVTYGGVVDVNAGPAAAAAAAIPIGPLLVSSSSAVDDLAARVSALEAQMADALANGIPGPPGQDGAPGPPGPPGQDGQDVHILF